MSVSIYPVLANEIKLPFYLTGIGITDPEYDVYREKGLTSHQFLFTLEGKGLLEIDDKSFSLKEGSCLYLSPNIPHRYRPDGEKWKTAWIVFRGNELFDIMKRLDFGDYIVKDLGDDTRLTSIFDQIFSASSDAYSGKEKCSLLIYEMILVAKSCLCSEESSFTSNTDIAGKAIRYINKYYYKDITLEELAENSGVSLQHLCRCFKAKMNMRPIEYLARKRIAESKNLLLNSDLSIQEIAVAVGYSGATYFGMVFKKCEKISPSEFRKAKGIINI